MRHGIEWDGVWDRQEFGSGWMEKEWNGIEDRSSYDDTKLW